MTKMTKTFKLSLIFFITTVWYVLIKILAQYIPLSDNWSSWIFSFLIQIIGMGIIPILLYKQWIGGDIKKDFHLNKNIHPMTYLLAIIIGFLLYYLTIGVSLMYQNIIAMLGYTHVSGVGTIYSGVEVLVLSIITVGIFPAFFEEFIDRGLLLSIFKDVENEKTVVVLMALIFAFAHQNVVQTGYTFVGGLVLAYIALKTRSIFPTIIIHFINNTTSVIFDYSSQTNGFLGALQDNFYAFLNKNVLLIIASWIAVAFVIVYLCKIIAKLNYKKVEDKEIEKMEVKDSIYSLFGLPNRKPQYMNEKTQKWEYGMLIASFVLSILCTTFTFMWGIIR